MPALLSELDQLLTADPAQDVEPPQAEVEAEAPQTEAALEAPQPEPTTEADVAAAENESAIPDVVDPEAVDASATASQLAYGDPATTAVAADTSQLDRGMYEPEDYQLACVAAGLPERFEEKFLRGHTAAKQWVQPYEGRYDNAFELKPLQSASQAVKDFVAGPTISDYRVIGVAYEMDELRDSLGDVKFDEMFGSADVNTDAMVPHAHRLKITSEMYTIPFVDQMLALVDEHDAVNLPAEVEAPVIEARVEEKPEETVAEGPAPELIADELGVERKQEHA
jgi:hypothetical protein